MQIFSVVILKFAFPTDYLKTTIITFQNMNRSVAVNLIFNFHLQKKKTFSIMRIGLRRRFSCNNFEDC